MKRVEYFSLFLLFSVSFSFSVYTNNNLSNGTNYHNNFHFQLFIFVPSFIRSYLQRAYNELTGILRNLPCLNPSQTLIIFLCIQRRTYIREMNTKRECPAPRRNFWSFLCVCVLCLSSIYNLGSVCTLVAVGDTRRYIYTSPVHLLHTNQNYSFLNEKEKERKRERKREKEESSLSHLTYLSLCVFFSIYSTKQN